MYVSFGECTSSKDALLQMIQMLIFLQLPDVIVYMEGLTKRPQVM